MPLELEIGIPEASPALEQKVGEAKIETICSKDRDNSHVRSDRRPISDGINCLQIIPDCYIRPPSERPRLTEVVSSDFIPLVDLDNLNGSARHSVIRNIKHACQQYGFFQIVNHGVQETVIKRMLEVAREFFTMPAKYREHLYSEDPSRVVRLSTSFNIQKEDVFNWRDFLRHHCYPLEDYIDYWPTKPSAYREVASKYCTEVRAMTLRLLDAISESLGLEPDFLNKALGKHAQHMAINYYPRCPNPELTYGLPSHTDPNALTVLLQDQVSGLQVLNKGTWIAVQPIPNSYVVNIGDQLQVLSNGIYKSAIHRAIVNSSVSRISIPTFYCPSPDAVIEPASSLINPDNPVRYGKFTYEEYYQKFWSKTLDRKACLDYFAVNDANKSAKDETTCLDFNGFTLQHVTV
jgi:isopenicillin N synthase-like dioxygenase